ncbi:phage fiber-tail adaptor protein [Kineobactrum salinum]|uniref:Uncharacterized protein n=1 Tax=Kineobactrum salinum TaxID=2708301 RepID=A0A6C0U4V4_9GAMM|nr:hypothetical protein [Kineobactrum salinum]QIB67190.1 hypothetical protein G3T16_19040 [Kineobactrum salinum]
MKDVDATLDFRINWTRWLPEESVIVASEWIVDDTLVEVTSVHNDQRATILVRGGVVGQRPLITNRITTSDGLVDDRTIRLKITQH